MFGYAVQYFVNEEDAEVEEGGQEGPGAVESVAVHHQQAAPKVSSRTLQKNWSCLRIPANHSKLPFKEIYFFIKRFIFLDFNKT